MARFLILVVALLFAGVGLAAAAPSDLNLNGADIYIHSEDANSAVRFGAEDKYWVLKSRGGDWRGEESFHVTYTPNGATLQSNILHGYVAAADTTISDTHQPLTNSTLPFAYSFIQVELGMPLYKIKKSDEDLYWTSTPTSHNTTHNIVSLEPLSPIAAQKWAVHRILNNEADIKAALEAIYQQPAVREAMMKAPKPGETS